MSTIERTITTAAIVAPILLILAVLALVLWLGPELFKAELRLRFGRKPRTRKPAAVAPETVGRHSIEMPPAPKTRDWSPMSPADRLAHAPTHYDDDTFLPAGPEERTGLLRRPLAIAAEPADVPEDPEHDERMDAFHRRLNAVEVSR